MTIIYIVLITIAVLTLLALIIAMLNLIAISIPMSKTNDFWDGVEHYTDKVLDFISF